MSEVCMAYALFDKAQMIGADLSHARAWGASFRDANLEEANPESIKLGRHESWMPHENPEENPNIAEKLTDFTRANLSRTNLTDVDFDGSDSLQFERKLTYLTVAV